MKKNLIFRLLLLGMLSISLNSCRTDEMISSTEQTQKEKIAFFARFEQEKSLSKNAESNNYALPFGNSMLAYFDKYPDKKIELESKYGTVDLRVSSQDIGGDEGDNRKLLFFPMLKGGKVTAVIAGVINAERDYLYFDVHQNTHSDVFYLINKFQEYYDTKAVSRNSNNPIDVGEVIIRVIKPVKLTMYDGWAGNGGPGNGGHDMDGGPGDYGGGGTGTPNQPATNPCEQTKKMIQDSKVQDIVKDLKDHLNSGTGGEKGWRDNKTGNPTPTTQNSAHSVNFGDPSTMNGGYHNHTGTGVNIFSSTDISTLIEIARYQSLGNAGNGYMGLVAPGGIHYVIQFNGNHSGMPVNPFTAIERDGWNTAQAYWKDNLRIFQKAIYATADGKSLNSKGLEKIFFDTLKEMNLENKIILLKVDANGKVSTINLQSNGVPIEVPC
ncbi:hypothetical protein EG347_09935 [Chryseobacterium sp. G0186]|uniref:hypothetical protein n=1 Tax=Chryseobacterium sp. G0186 TaxID=2487064 RepID=UPI000F4E7B85|nr:hypothetical protein [Chryseobacterium sp. G0186]AZA77814.1 hypothetical protein EG347_09935 [Chryseobacterium sp. G0186]